MRKQAERNAEIVALAGTLPSTVIGARYGISHQRVHQIFKAAGLTDTSWVANPKATEARFWSRVRRGDGCWEWEGSRTPLGYGHARWNGKREYAHRVSYRLRVGDIPAGMEVCHHCDNPPCVRPDHLWLGTHAENIRDRDLKGRWVPRREGVQG